MGHCPDWYRTIRASRYLNGVAPWELSEQPLVWTEWALASEEVEIEAREAQRNSDNPGGQKDTT